MRSKAFVILMLVGCGSVNKSTATDAPLTVDSSQARDAAALDAPVVPGGPDSAGPFTVAKTSATIRGATLTIYTPSSLSSLAPLVIMKHGFQLKISNYDALCTRVASHGFVVIGVDTGGGIIGGPTNIDERNATVAAIDYAAANLPMADINKVAMMGHSRGGKVAVMVAAQDARIDASLLLDPVNGCGNGGFTATCPDVTAAAIASAIKGPIGIMGETNNATGNMACAPAAQNYVTVRNAITQPTWNVEWTFTGADHMDFTDDGGGIFGSFCTAGPGNEMQIRNNVKTLAVAFMRRHLRNDAAMDVWLTGASLPGGITKRGP
jgi:pimeloyl-ACP methyl ester carboxylesterase